MNLLLPELDTIPTDPDAVPLLLADDPPAPADLPGWMPTDRTPLEAVMAHDAVDIVAAILALGATSTDDVPALRDYLAKPIAHETPNTELDEQHPLLEAVS